jgi:bifunctional DNA-binding transcriptional regulator/antitoxin component of YhaV-PrlF toxin-antitoxin module
MVIRNYLSVAFGYPIPELPIEFEVKVVEVGNSLRVAIPVEILRATGIQKGDMLLMTTNDSEIIIRKPTAGTVKKKRG